MAAVLLDRDGVINEDSPGYVLRWEEFRFLPGALEALAALGQMGLRLAIVTNQSAVGRGLLAEHELAAIHQLMLDRCVRSGARIEGIFVCSHAPWEGCDCRKPRPGLFRSALAALNERAERCVAVGDSIADLRAAAAADVPFVLVRTGRGEETLRHPVCRTHPPVFVGRDLSDVARTLPAYFDLARRVALS